jgi:hypothetical protein
MLSFHTNVTIESKICWKFFLFLKRALGFLGSSRFLPNSLRELLVEEDEHL